MNQNLQELALYLAKLYMDVPISEQEAAKLSAIVYNSESTRFEIIMNIDSAIAASKGSKSKVTAIEVSPADDEGEQYKIKFLTEAIFGDPNVSPTDKIKKFLGSVSNKPGEPLKVGAGFYDLLDSLEDPDAEQEAIMDELESLSFAINLVRQIEQHQIDCTRPTNAMLLSSFVSALAKYIPKIEEQYIKPYFNE